MNKSDKTLLDKTLLIVAHTPSANTRLLVDSMLQAAKNELEENNTSLQIIHKPALDAEVEDVLKADAIILMTPENLGYMSGGMKDFFDRVYYPCLEVKQGLPVAAVIRAGHDGTGTKRALETITTGLRWRWVQEPMMLTGDWTPNFIPQVQELAQAITVALQEGII